MKVDNYSILLATVANIFYIIYCIIHLYTYEYLPSPFFFDANDNFMDYFNTYYWSFDDGRYIDWQSIYLPITFIFFKIIGSNECILSSLTSADLRDCHINSIIYLLLFYIIIPFLVLNFLWKNNVKLDKKNYFSLVLFIALSFPMLFSMERGNTILISFLFFVLFLSNFSNIAGPIYLAIAVLFKPYLLILYIPILLKYKIMLSIRYVCVLTVLFLITYIIMDDPNAIYIFENMRNFSSGIGFNNYEKLAYTTSMKHWVTILDNNILNNEIISQYNAIKYIILLVRYIGIFVAVYSIFLALKYIGIFDRNLSFLILINSFLIITDSAGPYGILFLIPLVLYMYYNYNIKAIIYPLILLLLLLDGPYLYFTEINYNSWFSDHPVDVIFGITIGSILRPIYIILISIIIIIFIKKNVNNFKNKRISIYA